MKKWIDLLAQLVEHNTFNVGVVGSSPTGITKFCSISITVIIWPCQGRDGGSIPLCCSKYNSGKVPERSNGLDCKSSASASEVRILPFPQKASQVGIHCKIVLQNGVVPRCKNIDKSLWFVRGWTVESIRDSTNVTTEIIWML